MLRSAEVLSGNGDTLNFSSALIQFSFSLQTKNPPKIKDGDTPT
jgi:hypothetical protein